MYMHLFFLPCFAILRDDCVQGMKKAWNPIIPHFFLNLSFLLSLSSYHSPSNLYYHHLSSLSTLLSLFLHLVSFLSALFTGSYTARCVLRQTINHCERLECYKEQEKIQLEFWFRL